MKNFLCDARRFWLVLILIGSFAQLAARTSMADTYSEDNEEFLEAKQAFVPSLHLEEGQLIADWQIAEGYYLYRHMFKVFRKVANEKHSLDFSMPRGEIRYDQFLEKDIETFTHHIRQTVSLPNALVQGKGQAHYITLEAQGCSKKGLCYSPQQYTYSIDTHGNILESVNSETTVEPSNTNISRSGISQADLVDENNVAIEPRVEKISVIELIMFTASAFIGGLLLNLMPCVFPVLSLKALSFSSIHASVREQRIHGWMYTMGSVLSFATIAFIIIVARHTGESLGWGFQLQQPTFVIFMVYLFFIMGLNLMGFIEIGGAYAGMGQNLTSGHSRNASFFTGVLAVLVASPCTAPFMAPALGVALTQPLFYSLLIFVALGLGMASPFLLLSYFPSLSRYLPKPGNWMVVFKQLLAFPLFVTAIWLFWVLTRQTNMNTIALVLLGLVCITFSLWLLRTTIHVTSALHRHTVKISALLVLLPAFIFAVQAQSTPNIQQTVTDTNHFSFEKLRSLRNANSAVFIDVTADWCITCKVNENIAFTDRVLQELHERNITMLIADWTNKSPEIDRLLQEHNRSGVPLYVMYPADGGEAELLPQILTEDILISAMQRAAIK